MVVDPSPAVVVVVLVMGAVVAGASLSAREPPVQAARNNNAMNTNALLFMPFRRYRRLAFPGSSDP